MGLFSRSKPKIKVQTTKKDSFGGWLKCTHCQELIHTNELAQNWHCCLKCDAHYRMSVEDWIALLADTGSFVPLFENLQPKDPLSFVDTEPYLKRLSQAQEKSGRNEAICVGVCALGKRKVALGVMDFQFMGGSMGSVVGERFTRLIEHAIEQKTPVIVVTTSGGARMQESIFSLMQMAKTTSALSKFADTGLPYLVVLTDPTTGGVTASFASLGDLIFAEPDALICFAGPRVIEQTIGQKLPPGAQRAEFLLQHGMIDAIVRRPELKSRLVQTLEILIGSPDLS